MMNDGWYHRIIYLVEFFLFFLFFLFFFVIDWYRRRRCGSGCNPRRRNKSSGQWLMFILWTVKRFCLFFLILLFPCFLFFFFCDKFCHFFSFGNWNNQRIRSLHEMRWKISKKHYMPKVRHFYALLSQSWIDNADANIVVIMHFIIVSSSKRNCNV